MAIDFPQVQQELVQLVTPRDGVSSENPHLILIGGFQGAGKSTLAEHLRDKYRVTIFATNSIRQELVNRNIHGEPFVELVNTVSKIVLADCLNKRWNVVVDANAHQKRIREITAMPEAEGYRITKIYLKASKETLEERVKSRTEKNIAGIYQGTLEDLEHSLATVNMGEDVEYDLIINTDNFSIEEVHSQVDEFLSHR